jgi:hypothetical protein
MCKEIKVYHSEEISVDEFLDQHLNNDSCVVVEFRDDESDTFVASFIGDKRLSYFLGGLRTIETKLALQL